MQESSLQAKACVDPLSLGICRTTISTNALWFWGWVISPEKWDIWSKTKLRPANQFWFRSWKECNCRTYVMRSLVQWWILHYRWNFSSLIRWFHYTFSLTWFYKESKTRKKWIHEFEPSFEAKLPRHSTNKPNFNMLSKIDGCSLRRIGELPFPTTDNLKCVGIPSSSKSSDKILLYDYMNGERMSFMYVFEL